MAIVSIQSHVALGHVGNSIAVFALQRLGHEVFAVNTLQFSNHPGYGDHGGSRFTPGSVRSVLEGLLRRDAMRDLAAVVSGYLGDPGMVPVVADFVREARVISPGCRYCCDPVMGDRETGLYVDPALPAEIGTRLVPGADIVTPNVFELEQLVGRALDTEAAVLDAARGLSAAGPRTVVVTGLEDRPGHVGSLVVDAGRTFRVDAERVDLGRRPDGAGDLLTAMYLANYLDRGDPGAALAIAASAVHSLLVRAAASGARELPLVREQRCLVEPDTRLTARAVD